MTLIRCRILRRLIWVYTIFQCPIYGTPGTNRLMANRVNPHNILHSTASDSGLYCLTRFRNIRQWHKLNKTGPKLESGVVTWYCTDCEADCGLCSGAVRQFSVTCVKCGSTLNVTSFRMLRIELWLTPTAHGYAQNVRFWTYWIRKSKQIWISVKGKRR